MPRRTSWLTLTKFVWKAGGGRFKFDYFDKSSGDKGLIVTEEEWDAVIRLTNPATSTVKDNPWWEIIGSIRDVYRLLSKVVAVKAEAATDDVFGE